MGGYWYLGREDTNMFVGSRLAIGSGPIDSWDPPESVAKACLNRGREGISPDVRTAWSHGVKMPGKCHLYSPSDSS